MSEAQQNIALESDDESEDSKSNGKSNDPNVISFRDQKEFEAYLAANPQTKKNLYGDI